MKRAVVLAGGWAHPGDDLISASRDLLGPRGFKVDVVTEPHAVLDAIDADCDLLVVGACWFAMHDARYNDEQRAEHAVVLDADTAMALDQMRVNGVPLLALHTAVICFDAWEPWRQWLGGTWDWQRSSHPEPSPFLVRPSAETPIGFHEFEVLDELYQGLIVDDRVHRVAESAAGDPLIWTNETAFGRCVVNLLGHDSRSLTEPAHQLMNGRLLEWLLA